jgi:hypothetical protein
MYGMRWLVQRAEQLRTVEEASREERATALAGNCEFRADPGSHGLFWTLNLQS